ncbi:MAG: cation:proton antiporter [Chitinophagales bacterium]|nr:cation:proton antiporter [Chitinophagales bacterium]
MQLNSHIIVILLSSVVILSYFYTIISKKTNIPSVLLLIATGIGIKYFTQQYGFTEQNVEPLVRVLGAVGLVMIILEAALDLEVHKEKLNLIRNSFFSALSIFVISSIAIMYLIVYWLHEPYDKAFIYAVPLSIISSAIVIPSTSHLPEMKKEFIIYEASFSDIIGILVFNYMIMTNVMNFQSTMLFVGRIGLAIVISAIASLMLIYMLSKIEGILKFFLVFAILSIVYSSGELIHLPALIIILVFGSLLNNSSLIIRGPLRKAIPSENIDKILELMKTVTAETSFLVRTFFFILFGYTINLAVLIEPDVITIGTIIVMILLVARYIYLRVILKANLFPELFLMPRGLVTILLFYNIPVSKQLTNFKVGIIFYVVVVTSLLMMVGLMFFKKDKVDYLQSTEESAI